MALSEEDRKEIIQIMQSAISSGCMCGLPKESQEEMGHLIGRFKDIGNGNLSHGIESFSKAIQLMLKIRSIGESVGGAVAIFLFVSLAGGLIAVICAGIKVLISRQ